MVRGKGLKVSIHPSLKDSPVFDLRIVALTGFEFHLPFQVDVPCSKEAVIQIGVKSSDGHAKFRVVSDDLVGGLPL